MSSELGIVCHHQRVCSAHCDEYPVEIVRPSLVYDLKLDAQSRCRGLGFPHILSLGRTARPYEDRDPGEVGKQLPDQLQSLRYDIAAYAGHAGDVAARPGEACNDAGCDWVKGTDKHHRDLTRSGVPRRQH